MSRKVASTDWALYARQIEPTVKRLSARLEGQDDASSGQLPPDGLFKVVFAESHLHVHRVGLLEVVEVSILMAVAWAHAMPIPASMAVRL
jgi:hypothetical protein